MKILRVHVHAVVDPDGRLVSAWPDVYAARHWRDRLDEETKRPHAIVPAILAPEPKKP